MLKSLLGIIFFIYFVIQSTFDMSKKDYLQDITEIKSIMNKSTRFISLNGLSGILAGVYALLGAAIGYFLINSYKNDNNPISLMPINYFELLIAGVAIFILILSVITAFILTRKKAKKNNEKIWNTASKRLFVNFIIPLLAGGIFCIVLYQHNIIGLIAPTTLIFYGLACINASKYTLGDIFYLGFANVVIGLIATQFIGYGLFFWALGFGIFHIGYGIIMYNKHDK